MAAARFVAPKMASLMSQTASKAARPMVRSNMKLQMNVAQRGFSGLRANIASPLQTLKRQQPTLISRNLLAQQSARRHYSSEIADAMVQVSQNLGMGSAAIGLGGSAIGIGMVFAALLSAVARNPSMRGQLFTYAILGFAFVEAMGLFDLMVAMMCKYV